MIETLGLLVVVAAAGGVLAELLARVALRRGDAWYVYQPFSRWDYGIAADVFPMLPPRVRFAANADGERGDPVPRDPSSVFRVLVAGGSAAECYMLDQDDSWPMVVQRLLNERSDTARPAHVGNVARSLIPCRTIDPLLGKVLTHFESVDAIVLMVGASDLVDWFEARTPERLDAAPVDVAKYCAEHPQGPFGWKPREMALYRVARRLWQRLRRPVDVRENVAKSRAKHRAMRANAKVLLTETPEPTAMLEAFHEHLTSLIRTCRRHAPHVVVARQPWLDGALGPEETALLWNFGQGSPFRGELDTYYAIPLVQDLMRALDGIAVEVAEAEDAVAVDLPAEVPSDARHYYDFLHFTPAGAEVVGRAVADALDGLERDGRS